MVFMFRYVLHLQRLQLHLAAASFFTRFSEVEVILGRSRKTSENM